MSDKPQEPAEEALKKPEEEVKKAQEEMKKVLSTHLDPEEGAKLLAEINVQRAQLAAYRTAIQRRSYQLELEYMNISQQLAKLDCDEAVIKRQVLNKKES